MRTKLHASLGGVVYLIAGLILLGRAGAIQAWGIRMSLRYPQLYAWSAFQKWLQSPAYIPSLHILGLAALGVSALLFYAAHVSAK